MSLADLPPGSSLACPLAGAVADRAHLRGCCRGAPRLHRHAGDRALVRLRGRHLPRAAGPPARRSARSSPSVWDYARRGRGRRAAVDPRRPAGVLHDARRPRRLDADPPLLGRLHGRRPRLRALLRVPELLRLLDAAAGPGGQLPAADRRLGVRRRRLVPADLLLVPAHDGDAGRHQGVRHQRRRRRRPRARHVLHLQAARARSTSSARSRRVERAFGAQRRRPRRRAACCCSSARSRSPPRSRCTPGSRTRWRARRRSPR